MVVKDDVRTAGFDKIEVVGAGGGDDGETRPNEYLAICVVMALEMGPLMTVRE